MFNKIALALVVIFLSSTIYLAIQNRQLKQAVDNFTLTQTTSTSTTITKEEPSPFNQAHTDPLENFDTKAKPAITSLKFDKTVHSFGKLIEADVASTVFTFTNTGKTPLIISNAQGSSGCTVPQWPREPIAAGETGEIAVTFNSSGKVGQNDKTVTVTANPNPTTIVLHVKSLVVPKD